MILLERCEMPLFCHSALRGRILSPLFFWVGVVASLMCPNSAVALFTVGTLELECSSGSLPVWDQDLEIVDSLAYTVDCDGLRIIDVSNPAAPMQVGALETPGNAKDVEIADGVAYIADDDSGLRVIDVSNPAAPLEIGAMEWGAECGTGQVDVVGSLAYVVGYCNNYAADAPAWTHQLRIIDVSNPGAPVQLGFLATPRSLCLRDIEVVGSLAYTACGILDGGPLLATIDVSNPQAPVWLPPIEAPSDYGSSGDVEVVGSLAYAAGRGLQVIDVSNPEAPIVLGAWERGDFGPALAVDVEIVGTLAFLAAGSTDPYPGGGLRIIDVTNPAAPVEVGGQYADVWAVEVVGTLAYLIVKPELGYSDQGLMLRIIDLSNMDTPVAVRSGMSGIGFSTNDVQVVGDRAYVTTRGNTHYCFLPIGDVPPCLDGGLEVYDLSTADAPALLGRLEWCSDPPCRGNDRVVANAVEVVGGLAYVADAYSGLRIIDVSNPAAPVEIGVEPAWSADCGWGAWGLGVEVMGTLAYLTDFTCGLRIIDVSNPEAPVEIGALDTHGWGHKDFEIVGSLAYMADWVGLRIIDVSNPAVPVEVGALETPGSAIDVEIVGSLAYVADEPGVLEYNPPYPPTYSPSGLRIIDVSNPAAPVEVGALDIRIDDAEIEIVGSLAYMLDRVGVKVIDILKPSVPELIGDVPVGLRNAEWPSGPKKGYGLEVVGPLAYVTTPWGLNIIDFGPEYRDDDGDGVLGFREQLSPNGGDGNGDGTWDREQAMVASLPSPESGRYVTLESTSGCSSLSNVSVSQENPWPGGDPQYEYPFGLVGFTAPCPGFQGLKLYLHGEGVTDSIYRQYVPTTPGDINTLAWSWQSWTSFGSEVIGEGAPVSTVDLLLADGALGDSTDADGQMVHLGGPALFVPEPGLAASLLSGLLGLRWLERRRRGMGLSLP